MEAQKKILIILAFVFSSSCWAGITSAKRFLALQSTVPVASTHTPTDLGMMLGFESGTLEAQSGTMTVTSTTYRSGAYAAYVTAPAATDVTIGTFSGPDSTTSRCFVRAAIRVEVNTNPTTNSSIGILGCGAGGSTPLLGHVKLNFSTTGALSLQLHRSDSSPGSLGSAISINPNQWYVLELRTYVDGKTLEMRIDGVSVSTQSYTSADPIIYGSDVFLPLSTKTGSGGSVAIYYDDIAGLHSTGDSTWPGMGKVIARNGVSGALTNDSFVKTGGATIDAVLSDTPYSAASNATSPSAGGQQDLIMPPFTSIQTGHGTDVISATSKINGCSVSAFIKRSTGAARTFTMQMSWAGFSSGVKSLSALTTSDLFYYLNDPVKVDYAAVNTNSTVTFAKSGSAGQDMIIEDAWGLCDYVP